jgi:hypothetical protein
LLIFISVINVLVWATCHLGSFWVFRKFWNRFYLKLDHMYLKMQFKVLYFKCKDILMKNKWPRLRKFELFLMYIDAYFYDWIHIQNEANFTRRIKMMTYFFFVDVSRINLIVLAVTVTCLF